MSEQLGHVATSSPFSKSSYNAIKQHMVSIAFRQLPINLSYVYVQVFSWVTAQRTPHHHQVSSRKKQNKTGRLGWFGRLQNPGVQNRVPLSKEAPSPPNPTQKKKEKEENLGVGLRRTAPLTPPCTLDSLGYYFRGGASEQHVGD